MMRNLLTKKRLMIVGAIFLVLVLLDVGFFLYSKSAGQPLVFNLSLGPSAQAEEPATAIPTVEAAPEETLAGHGILMDMGTKVVNLADPGGYRYLRVGLVLEFVPENPLWATLEEEEQAAEEEKQREEISAQRAVIDDVAIGLLSDSAFSDIFSIAGKDALKEELRTAINERLGGEHVVNIYFTEFVIQ
jgi:flagellar FliL protein